MAAPPSSQRRTFGADQSKLSKEIVALALDLVDPPPLHEATRSDKLLQDLYVS